MKRKNAFTIVELLAVIVIIAIISVVGTIGVQKLMSTVKGSMDDEKKTLILSGAQSYGTDYKSILTKECTDTTNNTKYYCTETSVQELLNANYISTKETCTGTDNKEYPCFKDSEGNEIKGNIIVYYSETDANVYAKFDDGTFKLTSNKYGVTATPNIFHYYYPKTTGSEDYDKSESLDEFKNKPDTYSISSKSSCDGYNNTLTFTMLQYNGDYSIQINNGNTELGAVGATCYIYFSSYQNPTIKINEQKTSYHSIFIKAMASTSNSNASIKEYCFKIEDKNAVIKESICQESGEYLFDNLNPNDNYKVYSYANDTNIGTSNTNIINISTSSFDLPTATIEDKTYHSFKINLDKNFDSDPNSDTNSKRTIAKYYYSLDETNFEESTNNYYTFDNLEQNKNYTVTYYITDNKGIDSNTLTINNTTSQLFIDSLTLQDSTYHSLTTLISVPNIDHSISKYYYSLDDGDYIESDNNTYTFDNLEPNSTHKIKTYILDNNNYKSEEKTETFTTKEYINPKIDSLTITDTTFHSVTVKAVSIDGDGNVIKYYYSSDDGKTYEESTNNTYTFDHLNPFKDYTIKVYVKDNNNYLSEISSISSKTKAYIIPTINNVTFSDNTYNSFKINVDATDGDGVITTYYYSIDNGSTYISSGDNTYLFNNLTASTSYNIKVYVSDENNYNSSISSLTNTTEDYILPKINSIDISDLSTGFLTSADVTKGTSDIVSYCYNMTPDGSGGCAAIKYYSFSVKDYHYTTGNSYCFKGYVIDSLGYKSDVYDAGCKTRTYDYVEPIVNSVTSSEITENSFTLTVDATKGDNPIQTYHYSIDDGSNYIDSTNNTYTFNNLNGGSTYKVKVYVTDSYNYDSNINSSNVSTEGNIVKVNRMSGNSIYYYKDSWTLNHIYALRNDGTVMRFQDNWSWSLNDASTGDGYHVMDGINNLKSIAAFSGTILYGIDNNNKLIKYTCKYQGTTCTNEEETNFGSNIIQMSGNSNASSKYNWDFEHIYALRSDGTIMRYQNNWSFYIDSAAAGDGYHVMEGINDAQYIAAFSATIVYVINSEGKLIKYSCPFSGTTCTGEEDTNFGNNIIQMSGNSNYSSKYSWEFSNIYALRSDGSIMRFQDNWSFQINEASGGDGYKVLTGITSAKEIYAYSATTLYVIDNDNKLIKYTCSFKDNTCTGVEDTNFGTLK